MLRLSSVALALGVCLAATGTIRASDDSSTKSKFPHVRLGGIFIGAGYSHFSSPFWGYPYGGYYPYGGFGYGSAAWAYDPYFSPFFAPGYFNGFGYQNGYGEVKFKSVPKTATIFIDGAYAGTAGNLRQIWLEPGVYSLQVQDNGQTLNRKVYVLSGKTLRLSQAELLKSTD